MLLGVALVIGFGLGYCVREWISRRTRSQTSAPLASRFSDYRAIVDQLVCAFDRFTLGRKLSRSKRLIAASSDPDLQIIRTLN